MFRRSDMNSMKWHDIAVIPFCENEKLISSQISKYLVLDNKVHIIEPLTKIIYSIFCEGNPQSSHRT